MNVDSIKRFVIDRALEALHKETLDTFRVRYNNVYTSLVETRDIIQRIKEKKVKSFETVRYFIEETNDLLKNDELLKFEAYSKTLLGGDLSAITTIANLEKLYSNTSAVDRALFSIDKCLLENKDCCLCTIINQLENKISGDITDEKLMIVLPELDKIVSALCVQLIFEGYSKSYLYTELKRHSDSFDSFLNTLKQLKEKKEKKYDVIWKIRIDGGDDEQLLALGFAKELDHKLLNDYTRKRYKNIISSKPREYFFKDNVRALDFFSAVRKSRGGLLQLFDCLHLGFYSKDFRMPNNALVLEYRKRNVYSTVCSADYYLDGAFAKDYSVSIRHYNSLKSIYSSDSISKSVQDRIQSAIRHLNYGDMNSEIEQRFINYWIALEFIFASPQTSESTYSRIKSSLIDVLTVLYVKRNTNYLMSRLVSASVLAEEDNGIWFDVTKLDSYADNVETPLIWRYRLKDMKRILFGESQKMKEYYAAHINNLERHLARLYNTRNVLIHEGAIKQDVEGLASNLRYYLVLLIDQMIAYFSGKANENGKTYIIDDFFNEYHYLNNYISSDFKKDKILNVPLNKSLW